MAAKTTEPTPHRLVSLSRIVTERELLILRLRYVHEMTLEEIGQHEDVQLTKSRVSQIIESSFFRIRSEKNLILDLTN